MEMTILELLNAQNLLQLFRAWNLFYDCPGHKEYIDQIKQGINAASLVIFISDYNRKEESERYFEFIKELLPKIKYYVK